MSFGCANGGIHFRTDRAQSISRVAPHVLAPLALPRPRVCHVRRSCADCSCAISCDSFGFDGLLCYVMLCFVPVLVLVLVLCLPRVRVCVVVAFFHLRRQWYGTVLAIPQPVVRGRTAGLHISVGGQPPTALHSATLAGTRLLLAWRFDFVTVSARMFDSFSCVPGEREREEGGGGAWEERWR